MLWIPRVLLFPLYATNEYLLRRPIGWLIRHAEAGNWFDKIQQLFTFGEDGNQMLVPTALFDFGLLPSVGLYYAGDDLFAKGNSLRLHGATWGRKWIDITAKDSYALTKRDSISARFEFKRSEDNVFYGIGANVDSHLASRYGLEKVEGAVGYGHKLFHESRFDFSAGVRRLVYIDGGCCGNPTLDERIAAGELEAPPNYREDYTTAYGSAVLWLDSRAKRPAAGSGAFFQGHTTASFDLNEARSWINYGGVIGAAVDLTGHQRTIRMQLGLDFVDPMQGNDVPFTDLTKMSSALMPGFIDGWMVGRSTAAAQIGYTWPVWAWLDGQARFSVGNAFGSHLAGLTPGSFRFSGDIGVTTAANRDQGFEVLFGLGTETIDQGADITSVRVTFGSRRGF